jgi:hypothetical protein
MVFELFIPFSYLGFWLFLAVFGNEVTKILRNSLFTFFTEQCKTDKNGTHGNGNLATYFWYFGSFDEKRSYENM